MSAKIIIIACMMCLCAVKASVININVYDKDLADHILPSREVTECDSEECDEQCRRMGFAAGSCFGDSCQCTGMVKQNHILSSPKVAECNSEECDEQCRSMGFAGGSCFGDSCQCGGMMRKKKETAPQFYAMESCSPRACDQLCRTLGYPGGLCVGDNNNYCKCNDKLSTTLLNSVSTHQSSSVEECSPLDCDQLCRRIGFPGGACVNGNCKCDIILSKLAKTHLEDGCNPNACDQLCRRMGYTGGVCVGDRCKCDINFKFPADERKHKKIDKTTLGNYKISIPMVLQCDVVACNEMCHRLNYIGGMCRGDSCECY